MVQGTARRFVLEKMSVGENRVNSSSARCLVDNLERAAPKQKLLAKMSQNSTTCRNMCPDTSNDFIKIKIRIDKLKATLIKPTDAAIHLLAVDEKTS